jgi:hypothetical protein
MKRFIMIVADTQMHSLFAYEAFEVKPGVYTVSDDLLAMSSRPAEFFGQVDQHCITATKIRDAKPLEMEPPNAA